MQPRLTRSRSERVIWGVCGGLGIYFGVDPVIVRLIFLVLALTTGIGFLAYPLLALAMPNERPGAPNTRTAPASPASTPQVNSGKTINLRVDEAPSAQFVPPQPAAATRQPRERWRSLGVILLGLGIFFLADQVGFNTDLVWPVIIIGFGIWLLRRRA